MGATTFDTYALGKTAKEAFGNAVDSALYSYGHDGYTGSICEKPGFVIFTIPPGVRCSARRFVDLVGDAEHMSESSYLEGRLQCCKTVSEKRKIEARIRKEERMKAAWWRKINPKLVPVIQRAMPVYRSKWDECIAIEVNGKDAATIKERSGRKGTHDKVFLFAGWASC